MYITEATIQKQDISEKHVLYDITPTFGNYAEYLVKQAHNHIVHSYLA